MTATIPDTPTAVGELVGRDPIPPPPHVLEGTIVPHVQTTTLPSDDEWRHLAHQANLLANSDTVPRHLTGRPRAVMAVILKGRELGLAPIQAVSSIYFIEGTPTLSAHLMSALVKRAGHELWFEETSMERATLCGQRRRLDGSLGPVERVTYSWDEVPEILKKKDNWKNYRPAMLRARATTALCRMSFADVLIGVWYAPEELGARIDQSGSVVALPAQKEALEHIGALSDEEPDRAMRPAQDPVRDTENKVPESGLAPDTVDGEVVPPAEEQLDRGALWAELLDQARVAGQSPSAFTNRWVAAHGRNLETMTTPELAAFVGERRGYIAELLRSRPEAGDNTPTGKQPECPPDPEAPAAEAEPTSDEPSGDAAEQPPAEAEEATSGQAEPPAEQGSTDPAESDTEPPPSTVPSEPGEAAGQPEEATQETLDSPDTPV